MTQQLPKFGDWEVEDDVPYTVYFENSRKGKSSTKMNLNDPDMLPNNKSPAPDPSFQQEDKLKHVSQLSRKEGDLRRPTDSPLRPESVGQKGTVVYLHHRLEGIGTDSPKRIGRQGAGAEHSFEQSPLHPNHQARIGNKGNAVSSPSWERKGSSERSHSPAPFTPVRSRLRSVTGGDESPERGPAVPKFGDWDESDPAAAEGYTHIFNKVREEKQSGSGKIPTITTEISYSYGQQQHENDIQKGCGCFPWDAFRGEKSEYCGHG